MTFSLRALALAGFTVVALAGCGKGAPADGPGGPGGGMPPPDVGVITARAPTVPLHQQLVGRSAAPTSAPACPACCNVASTMRAATCARARCSS